MAITAKSVTKGQYRLAQATLSGYAKTPMPKSIAREIVEITPAAKRRRFARGVNPALLRRGNPEGEAADLYEKFTGRPSEEVIEIEEKSHFHKNLTNLGICPGIVVESIANEKVYAIGFDGFEWSAREGGFVPKGGGGWDDKPKSNSVLLSSNEKGNQFFFVGNGQGIDVEELGFDGDMVKEWMLIGPILSYGYIQRKKADGDQVTLFTHDSGEDIIDGRRKIVADPPWLVYATRDKRCHFVGGSYTIDQAFFGESRGIIK